MLSIETFWRSVVRPEEPGPRKTGFFALIGMLAMGLMMYCAPNTRHAESEARALYTPNSGDEDARLESVYNSFASLVEREYGKKDTLTNSHCESTEPGVYLCDTSVDHSRGALIVTGECVVTFFDVRCALTNTD